MGKIFKSSHAISFEYLPLRLASISAFLIVVSVCLLLSSCNNSATQNTSSIETCYDMTLSVVDNKATLNQSVLYQNTTSKTLTELKFHLYANAFSEDAENSPFLQSELDEVYYNGKSFGGIEVLSARIDRINCDFTLSGDGNTILTLPCTIENGESVCVSLESEITLPSCVSRFGITNSTINLTGFYPVLCRYENGAWREDSYCAVGDPFYSDISSFYVTASYPEKYTAGASGSILEATSDGIKTADITAEHIRDFALVLSTDYTEYNALASLSGNDVNVRYLSLTNKNAQQTANLAANAISVFSSAFGNYPYENYTVVEAPINSGGMEYGGMAIISSALSDNGRNATVIHETAHQWWYNTVGNDQINAAWLDEGLTEFCTYYYHSLNGDDSKYRQELASVDNAYSVWRALPPSVGFNDTMERSIQTFLTQGEYVAVVYEKGALLFSALLDIMGSDNLNACLRNYCEKNKFGIADKDSLIASFEKNGKLVGGIIESWVNGKAMV